MYYRNANCAVVVYDITQTVSGTAFRVEIVQSTNTLNPVLIGEGKGVD
jgi:GTPase SAR1 family protein